LTRKPTDPCDRCGITLGPDLPFFSTGPMELGGTGELLHISCVMLHISCVTQEERDAWLSEHPDDNTAREYFLKYPPREFPAGSL